jgi:hypothetical protein
MNPSDALPWLAPCCANCARSRGAAGAAGDTPAAPSSGGLSTGAGALLVLGAIFVAVIYGEKFLTKLGG